MRYLLPIFIGLPILEMWLLIEVGARIGALPTIGLVLLTAMIGLALLRQQGFDTLLRANRKLEAGEIPAAEVAEGFMLAIGGALLLTPGFVTDAVGFSCLLPFTRRRLIRGWLKNVRVTGYSSYSTRGESRSDGGQVFEGEFRREEADRIDREHEQ